MSLTDDLLDIDTITAAKLDDGHLEIVRDEVDSPPWEQIKEVMQEHRLRPLGFEELDGKPVTVAVLHEKVAADHLDWYER